LKLTRVTIFLSSYDMLKTNIYSRCTSFPNRSKINRIVDYILSPIALHLKQVSIG